MWDAVAETDLLFHIVRRLLRYQSVTPLIAYISYIESHSVQRVNSVYRNPKLQISLLVMSGQSGPPLKKLKQTVLSFGISDGSSESSTTRQFASVDSVK